MTKLSAVIQLTPEGTPKASEALLYYKLVGKEIKATPSVGEKPAPKNITLMGFASDVDPKSPLEDADTRSYEVYEESIITLEASGLDMADTKAMLLINGKVLMDPPNFKGMIETPEFLESAKALGDHPGLIIKHFLAALFGEKNIGGGCYLFKSMEDIESYLSSDFWKKAQENFDFWENVTYEAYEVCSE